MERLVHGMDHPDDNEPTSWAWYLVHRLGRREVPVTETIASSFRRWQWSRSTRRWASRAASSSPTGALLLWQTPVGVGVIALIAHLVPDAVVHTSWTGELK